MRRADRLFDIIQILRRRKLVRAHELARELEVSERTVYRDIVDLQRSGVPIEGEAGIGYIMRKGFDLPPLMFTETELEALVLGARIVESWTDPELAGAAANAIAKVEAAIPDRLRRHMENAPLLAPDNHHTEALDVDLGRLRLSIRQREKLYFAYQDGSGEKTSRTVRPLALSFYGPIWLLVSWCELRGDFRSFRLDRIKDLEVTKDSFEPETGKTLNDYLKNASE
ncbi:MAG: YafY family transcriptional regulator [Gammaproteobacteria bacterium]|nr:YafY family transcriptional regulator [Gammaproteobacteria bacterium]